MTGTRSNACSSPSVPSSDRPVATPTRYGQSAMQAATRSSPATRARWLVLLACVCVCFPYAAALAQATAPRIAYVDMQRLIDNAPQMAEARDRLAREFAV